jgi:hypothetical protein
MKRSTVIAITVLAIAGLALGAGNLAGRSRTVNGTSPAATDTTNQSTYYPTQAECETTSGKECQQVMCDYAPEGKTIDEVCGKGYKKGYWSAKTN